MRRPLRKPHGLRNEDIENFESTAKYVIYLDGTNYVAINGDTGLEDSRNIAAHTVIQYAIDNGGAGVVSVKCDVALTAVITGVENVILDFNNHTITPATSFDMVFMKPNFQVKNARIDASAIAFTHTVFYFDGADQYGTVGAALRHLTLIENIQAESDSQQGRFVWMDCDAAAEWVGWVTIRDTHTYYFEYAFYLEASFNNMNCWVNANVFDNIRGENDKYFIFMTRTGNGVTSGNQFKINFQVGTDTVDSVTVDGAYNLFDGQIWDVGVGQTSFVFAASSLYCSWRTGYVNPAYITLAGVDNTVFSAQANGFLSEDGFKFFNATADNPSVYINGYDTGVTAVKYLRLYVDTDGTARFHSQNGEYMRLGSDTGLSLNSNSDGDIQMFQFPGTGFNPYLLIWGRDNADSNNRQMSLRWGGTANDEGEIATSAGDLFLNPTGVVKFGTKTGTGDAALDGYVTIKDAAGNTIKLATTA